MVRPIRPRFVRELPAISYFKPRGIPLSTLNEVVLKVEELEAIKLRDLEDLEQEECAKKMGISRGTFQRVLNSAKKKIADALVNSKAIKIEGGNYKIPTIRGIGRGGFGRRAGGPSTICVCPVCKNQQSKIAGLPCSQMKCINCGSLMTRWQGAVK